MHDLASPILDYKQPLPIIILHLLQSQLNRFLSSRGTLNRLLLVVLIRRLIVVVVVIHRGVQTALSLFRGCRQLLLLLLVH
jgi:hypothetical protein